MSKTNTAARTSAFAHLLSSTAALAGIKTGARAEEDEDDEGRKARRAEEDQKREEEDARRAEEDQRRDDENARRAEEDGGPADDKDDKAPAGKKAEDDEDDDAKAENLAESDDDDEEMAKARREGFLAAQARGRRIFGAASAGVRPDVAAHLALSEDRPSAEAIAMLDMVAGGAAPSTASGSRLGRRMARVVIPNPGTGPTGKKPDEMSFGELAKAAAVKAGILTA
jgi:hypothetical protein